MKFVFILLFCSITACCTAQITAIWKGNAPGHPCDWNWPGNWSNSRLPDAFTDVFIPVDNTLSSNYPILQTAGVEINSLTMHPGASIIIKKGELSILDAGKSHYRQNQILGRVRLERNRENSYTTDDLTTIKSNKF